MLQNHNTRRSGALLVEKQPGVAVPRHSVCVPPRAVPTRFAHVFSETGKYVLVDSAVPERSVVVVVSDRGTQCDPRAAVFQPQTPAQLVRFGILKQHRLNLLPDWGVIVGGCLFACFVGPPLPSMSSKQ